MVAISMEWSYRWGSVKPHDDWSKLCEILTDMSNQLTSNSKQLIRTTDT